MDLELNEEQQAIVAAVEALLEQRAGPARAIALQAKGEYDRDLEGALAEAGFLDVGRGQETGPLEAALVTEAVARAGGVIAAGAACLVAPALGKSQWLAPIALALEDDGKSIRFGASARTLLLAGGAEARLVPLKRGDVETVRSNFGYPVGRVVGDLADRASPLGEGSGERVRSWWRLALAVEAVGTMQAALDVTVAYLKQRRQFGRTIGSFQGVQHRLAECAVLVEGSRWLAYEAADKGAPPEMTATAAAWALSAAGRVFVDTHQLSGAIGFTREHDLHVWSMRLQALRLELGGVSMHRREIARTRWGAST